MFLVLIAACFSFSCAEKKTGSDDNDSAETDDDDSVPTQGVGSYTVKLNMVPVLLGKNGEIKSHKIIDIAGNSFDVDGILLSEVIANLEPFADDADDFIYEFINYFDESTNSQKTSMPAFDDLSKAVFYEGEEEEGLCVGWSEAGFEQFSICQMGEGTIVTHPIDDAFDFKTLEWVNQRTGENPDHLGDIVLIKATVYLASGTTVSGSYLKTYVQQDGYGLKIFADMSAGIEDQGYDGALFSDIYTFEGDEVFVKGRITAHDNMIEFVPLSGYHLAVLSQNNSTATPLKITIDELIDAPYRYAGALVFLEDLIFTDIDPGDPATDWPEYGLKSKEIRVKHSSGSPKIGLPIYEGTGIPGSIKPEDGFDAIGAFNLDSQGYSIYPRKIEDINPVEEKLSGTVKVTIYGENKTAAVNLATLPACNVVLEHGSPQTLVVSIASVIRASGITRNPKLLEYKPVAYDGRKPFDTIIFTEAKSGVLYRNSSKGENKESGVNSFFWEGMNLSDIYYLNGVSDVFCYRDIAGPEEGDAEHGKGVTLMINGKKFVVNFENLTKTTYDGKEAVAIGELISDDIIQEFTMAGSFTLEQIKILYDYRFESFDGSQDVIVKYSDLENGYLVLADPPYTVFTDLGDQARIDDAYVVDMMRFMEVKDTGGESEIIYLRNLDTEPVDVGDGEMEEVVFFGTVLEAAGIDTSTDMYLYDFVLYSSDDFSQLWPFIHDHLNRMFFRPYANRGFTVDTGLGTYGGRVSTKAVNLIRMTDIPQSAPSIQVDVDGDILWGSDANSCEGCHLKNDSLNIPIDCFSCHGSPAR